MTVPYSEFYEMYEYFKGEAEELTLYEAVEEWLRIEYARGEMANFRYEMNLARGE
ncbi:hypothetical protein [uncultured Ilyobacter sp.]|uniref:hypothetical protein n=1 Tax=uncultured Ilyobacter sp. TaxID=544433 RepID=UPI0029C011AD|nr:hypothetical protein [uncultured Ilyobacter sp.]